MGQTRSPDEPSIWGVSPQNSTGRLTHTAAAGGTADDILSYDQMGRVADDWQCTPYLCGAGSWHLTYTYNHDGTMATSTNGQGVTFTYTNNVGERLTAVTSSFSDSGHPATLFSAARYDAFGHITYDSLGNGINESAGFDPRGRLQYVSAVNSGSTTVYSLNSAASPVSYAPNSNITAANDSVNGAWTYSYDALNRIASAGKSGLSVTFFDGTYGSTIDRNANLGKQYVNGNTQPDNTPIDATTNRLGSITSYDDAGNVRQWNDGSMTHTYTYDAEGRIVSIDSGSIQYTYDVFGRRVEKNVNGNKDEFVYDLAGNIVADMNGANGVWSRGEVWAGGRHLATYADSITYFAHTDWLGTERVETNVSGNVARTCTSNPYGDSSSCTGTYVTPYNFAGMESDTETGFYHTQYRYYNPRLGSWMTPDPAGMAAADLSNPQSLNRYAYVLDNPLNGIDPTGLCDEDPNTSGVPCQLTGVWAQTSSNEPGCTIDGVSAPCSTAMGLLSSGAGCLGSCVTSVTGSNGRTYQAVQTAGPTVYVAPNGEELSDTSIAELGLPPLSGLDLSSGGFFSPTSTQPYLSVTSDSCSSTARNIHYQLNGAKGYVWEVLTAPNGNVWNNTRSASLNGYPDFISAWGTRSPITQRFVMNPKFPQPGTHGTPLQIQQIIGGWPVLIDRQVIQRTTNNIYVAGKPCPK